MTNVISYNGDPYNWLPSTKQRILLRCEKKLLKDLCKKLSFDSAALIGHSFQYDFLDPIIAKKKYMLCLNKPVVKPAYIKLCRASIEHPPLAENTMDIFVLPHIVEHVENPSAWIAEMSACVKASGYFLIFQFSPYSLSRLKQNRRHWIYPYTLKQLLRKHNFKIKQTGFYGHGFTAHTPPAKIERFAQRFIPFNHLGYYILAKKQTLTGSLLIDKLSAWKSKRQLVSQVNFTGEHK